jgi:hypothetical protein
MRFRSTPHRGPATKRSRTRAGSRAVTLPPPDPWTDRDFAFHVRETLRRRAYVPSAEARREREAGDWAIGPAMRGWDAATRPTLSSEVLKGGEPRADDRGHADTSLRDEIAHRIVSEVGDAGLDVSVKVFEGIVTLEGPVPERVTKEMLHAIVEACPGVRGVDNRLRVDWLDETPGAARAPGAPDGPSTGTMKRTG